MDAGVDRAVCGRQDQVCRFIFKSRGRRGMGGASRLLLVQRHFEGPKQKTCLWHFSGEQHQPSTYLTKFRIQQLLVSNSHDISIASCLCLTDFLIPHPCQQKSCVSSIGTRYCNQKWNFRLRWFGLCCQDWFRVLPSIGWNISSLSFCFWCRLLGYFRIKHLE